MRIAARTITASICCTICAPPLASAQECQSTRLTPSTFGTFDHFGRSLSLDGDRLAVGSSQHGGSGTNTGAVFVYQYADGDWSQTAMLEASDPSPGDRFGESVCLSGDTLAIGAFGDDDKGSNAGAVYIFKIIKNEWIEVAKITADDTAENDRFGNTVSLLNDLLVVGAPHSDIAATNAGAAYTFRPVDNIWTEQTRLDAASPQVGDAFGHAVDTDGISILVSAHLDDENGTDSGSAAVFVLENDVWIRQATIVPADGHSNDWFAFNQVSIEGDLLVIGALADDDRGTNSGSVYVYERTNAIWRLQDKLAPSSLLPFDSFGKSLDLKNHTLLVGARFDDRIAWNAGAAYLFDFVGGNWRQRSILTSSTGRAGAEFGRGIAIGQNHFAIGGHKEFVSGTVEVGAAWMYELAECSPCYADCDQSTGPLVLDIFDFLCFQSAFVTGQVYACDCDFSSGQGVCDLFDFLCFQSSFVVGCQ